MRSPLCPEYDRLAQIDIAYPASYDTLQTSMCKTQASSVAGVESDPPVQLDSLVIVLAPE